MFSAITCCLPGFYNPPLGVSNSSSAFGKKDDDFYSRMIESWITAFQIEKVDSDEKVEAMVEAINKIPPTVLTTLDIRAIGDIFRGVASKKTSYKQELIRLLRKQPNSELWLDRVYTAIPPLF